MLGSRIVLSSAGRLGALIMLAATSVADAGDAAPASERMFTTEAVMRAPVADVWRMWSTNEGVKSFGIPGANIELRAGGPYEWYFATDAPGGQRGAEGCTVLAYIPNKMIAFTWNAPPTLQALRDAGARTNVIVTFDELPGQRTRVQLHQLGYGTGEDWDKYYAYFENAWPKVLEWMQKKCDETGGGPAGATAQGMAALEPLIGTWKTGKDWDESEGGIRVVYGWGLNKQSMHVQSFRTSKGVESQVYETVISWHPKNKQFIFRSVSSDGGLYDGVAEMVGDSLHWDWDSYSGDRVNTFRQSQKLVGSDKYDWAVYAKSPDGWKLIKEATFTK